MSKLSTNFNKFALFDKKPLTNVNFGAIIRVHKHRDLELRVLIK